MLAAGALEGFGAGHPVTASNYSILQDYEAYKETFALSSCWACPRAMSTKFSNAQALFRFRR
jgi:hypothetical protein